MWDKVNLKGLVFLDEHLRALYDLKPCLLVVKDAQRCWFNIFEQVLSSLQPMWAQDKGPKTASEQLYRILYLLWKNNMPRKTSALFIGSIFILKRCVGFFTFWKLALHGSWVGLKDSLVTHVVCKNRYDCKKTSLTRETVVSSVKPSDCFQLVWSEPPFSLSFSTHQLLFLLLHPPQPVQSWYLLSLLSLDTCWTDVCCYHRLNKRLLNERPFCWMCCWKRWMTYSFQKILKGSDSRVLLLKR